MARYENGKLTIHDRMASRYKGWRPSVKDLSEINGLRSDAAQAVKDATQEMSDSLGIDYEVVSRYMPYVAPAFEMSLASKEDLLENFGTRADFDRYKRYLSRIVKASKAKPSKGAVTLTPDLDNQLTAFHMDEYGNLDESVFMRRERKQNITNRNRRAAKLLEAGGIELERVPVMVQDSEGNYKYKYDDSRHKVYVLQPKTPMNQQDYETFIQYYPDAALVTPDSAIGGVVNVFDDMVDVRQRTKHRMTPKAMAESQLVDTRTAMRTELYFDNYEAIVQTTLPDEIAEELSGYINKVKSLPPTEQAKVYDYIATNGEDVATIEFLYSEMGATVNSRIQRVMLFWRSDIAPLIGADVPEDAPDMGELSSMLEDYGYAPGSARQIFGEYQERRQAGEALAADFTSIRSAIGIRKIKPKKLRGKGRPKKNE